MPRVVALPGRDKVACALANAPNDIEAASLGDSGSDNSDCKQVSKFRRLDPGDQPRRHQLQTENLQISHATPHHL